MNVQLVFVFVVSTISFVNGRYDPMVSNCHCDLEENMRASCSYYKPNMEYEECSRRGCCYVESKNIRTPNCFQKRETCPPQKCRITPNLRSSCSPSSVSRITCVNLGCCFDAKETPNCYYAADGESVDPYAYHPQQSMFASSLVHPGWSNLQKHGPYRAIKKCYAPDSRPVERCGRLYVNQEQCKRFECCWDETKQNGMQCYKSVWHVVRAPKQSDGSWSDWSTWSTCSSLKCAPGLQSRSRTCNSGTAGYNGCAGTSTQTQVCYGCKKVWDNWGKWGKCKSPEPGCLAGKLKRKRLCKDSREGKVEDPKECDGGIEQSVESKSCNTNLCTRFSAWTNGKCNAECGGGTRVDVRSCESQPRAVLDSRCYRATVSCNTLSCSRDKNLDLMFIMDSSNILDKCNNVQVELGMMPPITLYSANRTAIPNFFQQTLLVSTILSGWRSIGEDYTNVAIQQMSGVCMGAQSNHNPINFLTPYKEGSLFAALDYKCGTSSLFTSLHCAALNMAAGNRPNVPDAIVMFIPDVTYISARDMKMYRMFLRTISSMIGTSRLYTVSAANHNLMTPLQSSNNVLFCKQFACRTLNPNSNCQNYLGNIYDVQKVLANLRLRTSAIP